MPQPDANNSGTERQTSFTDRQKFQACPLLL
jgi:hypothetical protein